MPLLRMLNCVAILVIVIYLDSYLVLRSTMFRVLMMWPKLLVPIWRSPLNHNNTQKGSILWMLMSKKQIILHQYFFLAWTLLKEQNSISSLIHRKISSR